MRSILVTGSSSGIGAAIARRLAAPGIAIAVHARKNMEGAERVAAELRDKGAKTTIVQGDLTVAGTPAKLIASVVAAFGGLDVLVSNAGFADKAQFGELTAQGLTASYEAITTAFFELATAAMEPLSKAQDGRVVAVGSFVSHVYRQDIQLFPASAAAKAGMEALAKVLSVQMAPKGVTVNVVAPGFTRKDPGAHTAMTEDRWRDIATRIPLGRIGEPQDIAAAVAYFASPEASYVTGQVLHVSGGLIV